jgi:lipopolysaccharide export system protein LptA
MGRKACYTNYFLFFLMISVWQSGQVFSQETKTKTIIIENADITEIDNTVGTQRSRLLGNVRFTHQDVFMSCDSAYFYSELNVLDAFSRVHIWRGDTLDLYGDFLKYKGDIRLAEVRRNVILDDKETHLTTENIDYDLNNDIAYYFDGGKIKNGENTLVSELGYYYSKDKLFFFKDSVVITNPDYVMYSDTLKYNTVSKISYFLGPTDIISDSNFIYCENGWYDTDKNISQFNKNAYLQNKEKTLRGDSIYYERETGLGKAFMNVRLTDTIQNLILLGNYGKYEEKSGYALLTDSALMIQVDKGDSMFVHADTLKTVSDTIPEKKLIKAYRHVKIFRRDLQGKCDSLVYAEADSVFRFYGEPVLWSEANQLTADFIAIQTRAKGLYKIDMKNAAFIISKEDSSKYNQIKGRDMQGWFRENQLYLIDVNGNGQTIYYARDKGELQGVNKAESATLKIYLKDRKIERINFVTQPEATYYPLAKFPPAERKLENFRWFEEYRPVNRYDVFRWK